MVAVVDIVSRCGLSIYACHTDKPIIRVSKRCISHSFTLILQSIHIKQLYICNKMVHFSNEVGVVGGGVIHVSMCFKDGLAWATDERP